MKIHQLPEGARFEYEGAEYVKTGPMIGTGKAGQRLIPRYAVLMPLDAIESKPEQKLGSLPRADVLNAFETFYAECMPLVLEDRHVQMQAARDRLLESLALN